jgi:aspartyl-tRNA(Asn)/glutamyl-tRNA(Gln) amidotransferase subunit B
MSQSDYTVTVGLEIHAELKTKTKMFCDSKNDPDEKRPNVNICPVCMGYPGTLPVINKEAMRHVIRMGVAVGGTIADFTEFDRKNYFYPDIPKGYQISQYEHPLVKGGILSGIAITRIHLEEDTAKSTHQGDVSLVDFNRAGVPLMELVTEPVIHSAEDASRFAKELQLLLQTLGAGEANMEKGEMRVEANISVSKTEIFGTKVEVKNLNSFRAVEKAIAYEVDRHIKALEAGETLIQETRGWDESKEITFSQRAKEDSHDYRYFPDPDLPKIWISKIPEFRTESIKSSLPELPWEKRQRYTKDFGLKSEDSEVFVRQPFWGSYFEAAISGINDAHVIQTTANYLTSDAIGLVRGDGGVQDWQEFPLSQKIEPVHFSELMKLVTSGAVSSRVAKDVLKMMYEGGGNPHELVEKHGLAQKSDEGELIVIAQSIIDANPNIVSDYKSGKVSVLQFFVGQGMKATKGSANPEVLKSLFEKLLS